MPRSSYVTVTDQFCGAGGSSLGAQAAGAEIRLALNHWPLAVETHHTNFPHTDHDCTDVSACDPRRYAATDILITAPECTNHSLAKGTRRKGQAQLSLFGRAQTDGAAERSRATMWDVCRFAEAHQYRIVIVENVVEARHWAPFDAWLHAMRLLGYDHTIVYLNSMHAHPTPQSRDRMYVIFWQRALRAPNLRIMPRSWCPHCTRDVDTIQSWKNPRKPWGKYRQQYVYRCPTCTREVTPYYYCAANAIDWTIPAPRIGDRARPLTTKTLQRIRLGLEKFGAQAQIVGNYSPGWVRPVTEPTGTITTQDHHALLTPPPFLLDLAYTHGQDARVTPVSDPAATQTSRQTHAVVVPPYLIDLRGANAPKALADALSTVCATGNHHGLVMPFVTSYHRADDGSAITDALPTQDTRDRHALVAPPFVMGIHTAVSYRALSDSLQTVVGAGNHHFLAQPGATPAVEDCGFRMLQPHEIGRAMAFPGDYVVLGTQRERVKQYGNAVTPPVMRLLMERCLEVLG